MTTPNITVEELHHALGGEISRGKNGPQVLCPGPGHSQRDRSLAVAPSDSRDGFMVHSFANDDPIDCKDYVRDNLRLPPFRPCNGKAHSGSTQRKVAKTMTTRTRPDSSYFRLLDSSQRIFGSADRAATANGYGTSTAFGVCRIGCP